MLAIDTPSQGGGSVDGMDELSGNDFHERDTT